MEKFLETIEKTIINLNQRDVSKDKHRGRSKTLYKLAGDDIFDDRMKTIQLINDKYENANTKRSYYETLVTITGYNEYYLESVKFNDEKNEIRLNNVLSDNELNNWMNLKELKEVPQKVRNEILKKFNKVVWKKSIEEFNDIPKKRQQHYLQLILNYLTLLINIYHPLRLDYYNVKIKYLNDEIEKNDNYVLIKNGYSELHMNYYKNSDSYSKTNIQRINFTVNIEINNFIELYTLLYNKRPEYVSYRHVDNELNIRPAKDRHYYGIALNNLFEKYSGKKITIRLIRKIHESEFIQSDKYKTMTNAEKTKQHMKLLHSQSVAIMGYNMLKPNNVSTFVNS